MNLDKQVPRQRSKDKPGLFPLRITQVLENQNRLQENHPCYKLERPRKNYAK